jgi:hypothetical protein
MFVLKIEGKHKKTVEINFLNVKLKENNHLRKLMELSDDSSGNGQSRALLGSSHSNLPLDGRGENLLLLFLFR